MFCLKLTYSFVIFFSWAIDFNLNFVSLGYSYNSIFFSEKIQGNKQWPWCKLDFIHYFLLVFQKFLESSTLVSEKVFMWTSIILSNIIFSRKKN